jgi:hypothetical protein
MENKYDIFNVSIKNILSRYDCVYCEYDELKDIISGPFNLPSSFEISSGAIDLELDSITEEFEQRLKMEGLPSGIPFFVGFLSHSRCICLYLGDNLNYLVSYLNVCIDFLGKLKTKNLSYGASINLDCTFRNTEAIGTAYWFVCVVNGNVRCHESVNMYKD